VLRYGSTALVAALMALLADAYIADAHWRPDTKHNRRHAVVAGFCGASDLRRPCGRGLEALRVAECESGLWPYAHNGQYLGIFQMGSYARGRYGHSWSPWQQARDASEYYRDAGWSPWACAYIVGVL
jgi:hypothetical protein